jgi:hypothetical protein
VGSFVVLGLLAFAGVVLASHVAGRTYTGTFSGTPSGTVTFNVNAAGTAVTSFTVDVAGADCPPASIQSMTISNDAAAGHPYMGSSGGLTVLTGTFPNATTSVGTFTLDSAIAGDACDVDVGGEGRDFTATTGATASPTVSPTATPTSTPTATPTATPTRTPFPTRTPISTPAPGTNRLPNNGASSAVIALSGLSLLEAGWGLRLLSRRLQTPLFMVPSHLLRKLLSARRHGQDEVKLTEEWYLVWRKDEDR